MKKVFLLVAIATMGICANAQKVVFSDDFSTNTGWNEFSSKGVEALVKDGVLSLKNSEDDDGCQCTCWTNVDVQKNFDLTCDALVKNIDDESNFGLIIDYLDDDNYIFFGVQEGLAYYRRIKDGRVAGKRRSVIKLEGKAFKKTSVQLEVRKVNQSLTLLINEVEVLELRMVELKYPGIGVSVYGDQKVQFDNFKIVQ